MEQPTPTPPNEQQEIFTEADYSMEGYDKPIRNARIMLFIVAAMQLLPIILLGDVSDEVKIFTIIECVIVALMFAGLAFWTKKKPFIALLLAMILFVGLIALNAIIIGPGTIMTGFVVKILVILLLIMGLRNAKEAEDLRKTFGK